jgi:hypothetical protein
MQVWVCAEADELGFKDVVMIKDLKNGRDRVSIT